MNYGIVFADEMEYLPFAEYVKSKYEFREKTRRGNESIEFQIGKDYIIAVKCGIGKVNASTAAAFLIADDGAEAIINAGLAGGIKNVVRGDVVVGISSIECDFDVSVFGYPLGKKPGEESECKYFDEKMTEQFLKIYPNYKKALLGCGDFFMHGEKGADYKDIFNIEVFDMESGAIASVCEKAGIPCMSIKKISDNADDTAADDYTEVNDKAEITLTNIIFGFLENR